MGPMVITALLPLLLAAAQEPAAEDPAAIARRIPLPELRVDELDRWREHLQPRAKELAFEEIPWLSDFAAGLKASEAQGKPLLFWAMNGHPLGCT